MKRQRMESWPFFVCIEYGAKKDQITFDGMRARSSGLFIRPGDQGLNNPIVQGQP